MEIVHTPVLLNECLEYLSPVGEKFENDAFMIDSTLGEGGHSYNFLSKFPGLHIMGLDADSVIQAWASVTFITLSTSFISMVSEIKSLPIPSML